MNSQIHVYTDGSCSPNPGKGGWAWVELHYDTSPSNASDVPYQICDNGGAINSTNNRMELTAIIRFLEDAPRGKSYLIHSDSEYVLKSIIRDGNGVMSTTPGEYSGWLKMWLLKKFKKNEDLWREFDAIARKHIQNGTQIEFKWVKGHSGMYGNELADKLANDGRPR